MSLSIRFTGAENGDDGPFSLASASGWKALAQWAASLPAEMAHLKALVERGSVLGTDQLADQLLKALQDHRPDNLQVVETAENLVRMLGVGDSEERATVEE